MGTLATLLDKDAIRELLADYCFRLDGYELAELGSLFTATGRWISRNGQAQGPRGIESFMGKLVPPPGPGTRRKHFTTNIIIELDDADPGGRARVRSNFLVVRDTAQGPAIAVAGTYIDEVVRRDGAWRFERRELFHDIAGASGLNPS
jgi:hypothetical protein